MKAFIRQVLVAFVFVSYLQSALEINNDYISNTFCDEYDTYIRSDNISPPTILKVQYLSDCISLPQKIFELQTPATRVYSASFPDEAGKTFEQKRFLKNRSLLI